MGYKLSKVYPPTKMRIAELQRANKMDASELMGRLSVIGRNLAVDFISQDPETGMLRFDFEAMKSKGLGFLLKGFSQNSRTGDVHYEFHDPMVAMSKIGMANGALQEKKLIEVEAGSRLNKVIASMQEAIAIVNAGNAAQEESE